MLGTFDFVYQWNMSEQIKYGPVCEFVKNTRNKSHSLGNQINFYIITTNYTTETNLFSRIYVKNL